MDALVAILGKFLTFIKEVFVAIELEEGVKAIEDILATFPAEEA